MPYLHSDSKEGMLLPSRLCVRHLDPHPHPRDVQDALLMMHRVMSARDYISSVFLALLVTLMTHHFQVDEIEKWSSSSLTKSEKGILLLSNILGISSPGNAILPKFVLSRQHHDEPSNQLAPASCESFLVNPTLHIIADPAHTTVLSDSGLSGNTFSHGVRSAGAKFNRHSSDSDVNRDGDDTPPNRTTSSLQPETYHNIDAPVGFILPVMSFLLTSYLPQVREVVFEVKDDEDKEAFKSAVAREAAKLAGNLGFRVEN
ncbi:uncharacterized protein EI90DRAFT_3136320 [Cantharellus anzutake]|uniref:uncharacterized protein n=1 Tax=Cantharellus anzutake TaxID=1750568 RepID=UPI001907EC89|nr:uncharacterized protein EI90DRAFT_3136320 [Cantharellus anzutake]KAF8313952.1 hypothetical protein EI90DRAFT_3136320 [Cantharellus anzutake]